ncbi:MAG: bifunctional phosphopantothenoylcysteine decarboxylase/phosphopantothenate--cysteine ligase CoaBC [Granulosicoccus sp.]|nr:bifunctional phosphopantothenoylcysteine decarboxylase/phosphopantothenate--cysteine ligase CoaBC [Granulosicoccus sp.]
MSTLSDKNILLGISGGIAAYKSAVLARRLIDAGASVKVVMTQGAQAFVQPLTFQALTGQPVATELLDPVAEAAMDHIEMARWADAVVIAPATANTLARLAHGLADDLLSTLCLASDAPIFVAPAMNRMMWMNAATVDNCRILANRGIQFIGPGEGAQACGETGAGRMLEPEAIRDYLLNAVFVNKTSADQNTDLAIPRLLNGKRVLITAGPTREAIDPVRFISNRSSGKMGFAIAEMALQLGADVTLVTGPVSLNCSVAIQRLDVVTALEMHEAVLSRVSNCDVFIAVAAVSDYRLEAIQNQKIKKNNDQMVLSLVKNPDILKSVTALEKPPFCVGFAAETENVEKHARGKLHDKKLDMIAANHVAQEGNPVFGSDLNSLEVYWNQGKAHQKIELANKSDIARSLLVLIAEQLTEQDA